MKILLDEIHEQPAGSAIAIIKWMNRNQIKMSEKR